jgi:hypothetical protein
LVLFSSYNLYTKLNVIALGERERKKKEYDKKRSFLDKYYKKKEKVTRG